MSSSLSRRSFLAAAATSLLAKDQLLAATQPANYQPAICVFEKYLQSLSVDELAEVVAELGFTGIEATVRRGGRIKPERAHEELPQLIEALDKHQLEVTIMTTDVVRADDPASRRLLEIAAKLGIKRYRLGYHHYNPARNISAQLDELKPIFADLAAMNQQLGITGLYQNHAGMNCVGASLWDLQQLLEPTSAKHLAVAFDIRHAMVESGQSWEIAYRLIQPHISAVYVKDYAWQGRKDTHVPLGKNIDPRFFELLRQDNFSGPYSLHVEYGDRAKTKEHLANLRTDLAQLRQWLAS